MPALVGVVVLAPNVLEVEYVEIWREGEDVCEGGKEGIVRPGGADMTVIFASKG